MNHPIISEDPVLASILSTRKPLVLHEDTYNWVVSWVEDVGRHIRSREFRVSTVAYLIVIKALSTLGIF